jgi:hypothetical protein
MVLPGRSMYDVGMKLTAEHMRLFCEKILSMRDQETPWVGVDEDGRLLFYDPKEEARSQALLEAANRGMWKNRFGD